MSAMIGGELAINGGPKAKTTPNIPKADRRIWDTGICLMFMLEDNGKLGLFVESRDGEEDSDC